MYVYAYVDVLISARKVDQKMLVCLIRMQYPEPVFNRYDIVINLMVYPIGTTGPTNKMHSRESRGGGGSPLHFVQQRKSLERPGWI